MRGIGGPEGFRELGGIFKDIFGRILPTGKASRFSEGFDEQHNSGRRILPTEDILPIENVRISSVGPRQLEVMIVRLEISMPAVIRLRAQITLEVQISLPPNTPRPPGTEEVKLSIFSPGFRLLSAHVRDVSLSLTKEQSIRERFEMEAQEEGKHKIRVSVFVGGTLADSTTFEAQVDANAETGQASFVGSNIPIGTAKKGEVTLAVFYDGAQRAYVYELNSATIKGYRVRSKPLLRSPEEIIDVFVNRLNSRAQSRFKFFTSNSCTGFKRHWDYALA